MTKFGTSDRQLRSQKTLRKETENESEDDAEVSFRTTAGSRRTSTSEESEILESTLNMENDHNLNMSEDGGDGIELLDTETVQVHVDAPNGGACAAMGATAKATTTAATLPTPTAQMPPMQMMQPGAPLDSNTIMMMFQQMQMQQAQAQAQMQQQMQMFQESILAMKTPAPAPAKEPTLRLGKPPKFDLEKESITFNTWREKWTYYVKSSGIVRGQHLQVQATGRRRPRVLLLRPGRKVEVLWHTRHQRSRRLVESHQHCDKHLQ